MCILFVYNGNKRNQVNNEDNETILTNGDAKMTTFCIKKSGHISLKKIKKERNVTAK